MSASVLRSVTCGERLGLGCLGNKGREGTPEEPECSGNVSTISITVTGNTVLCRIHFYILEKMETSNYGEKSFQFHFLAIVSLTVSLSLIKVLFLILFFFWSDLGDCSCRSLPPFITPLKSFFPFITLI